MDFLRQLDAVPAYYAVDGDGRNVPFIVSLLLHDQGGCPRLTPAIDAAINCTVEITDRDGLVTAIICEHDTKKQVASIVGRAMTIEGAILLFRCQNAETAEALMLCMNDMYSLSLVRRAGIADQGGEGASPPRSAVGRALL